MASSEMNKTAFFNKRFYFALLLFARKKSLVCQTDLQKIQFYIIINK